MKKTSLFRIKKQYGEYFKSLKHKRVEPAPIVPENDSSTLFTGSGMQPLVPYLLGQKHPEGKRLFNCQPCFRSEDIEEVGDNRHTTFFEMLGNWSLGDYFKQEQITWIYKFFTDQLGIDPNRLYVTVFIGNNKNKIERDKESARIWKDLFEESGVKALEVDMGSSIQASKTGMRRGRIFYYDESKNWWSRAGSPEAMPVNEPGGPDSEVFYDFGIPHDKIFGNECHPNCDCGRFLEIGNSVFMEYKKNEKGGFDSLPQKNVDFGGGLERITAAVQGTNDIFMVDELSRIIDEIENVSGKGYQSAQEIQKSMRVITDHMRASVFIINHGITPSNTEQGYVLRRMIRRMVRHADKIGIEKGGLSEAAKEIMNVYEQGGDEFSIDNEQLVKCVNEEENKFRAALKGGLKYFNSLGERIITGKDAYKLYTSYGMPLDLIKEMSEEKGVQVDVRGYEEEMARHKEMSRAGARKKFEGGLANREEQTIKYHTATHLLQAALREVLGKHVEQRGSNITRERLRFDFSHAQKLAPEQIEQVENKVNDIIKASAPVEKEQVSYKEAKKAGSIGILSAEDEQKIWVYSVGDFSKEICGGPHVKNTKELGEFKIIKEEAAGAGVRRIKAVLN